MDGLGGASGAVPERSAEMQQLAALSFLFSSGLEAASKKDHFSIAGHPRQAWIMREGSSDGLIACHSHTAPRTKEEPETAPDAENRGGGGAPKFQNA
jgi:hypothetical protein